MRTIDRDPTGMATRWACVVTLVSFVGCRGAEQHGQTELPEATGAPALVGYDLHAEPLAMLHWGCRTEIGSRLGGRRGSMDQSATADSMTAVTFVVADASAEQIDLKLRAIETRLSGGPAALTVSIDAKRIVEINPTGRTESSADGDERARRMIDALLAEPHVFVGLDHAAAITSYGSDFPASDFDGMPGLAELGLAWLIAYPVLPGRVELGQTWRGTRPMPSPSEDQRKAFELRYRLVGVAAGVARIEFESEYGPRSVPVEEHQFDGSFTVKGSARVRVSDGAFLEGTADVEIRATLGDDEAAASFHYRSTCDREPKAEGGATRHEGKSDGSAQ